MRHKGHPGAAGSLCGFARCLLERYLTTAQPYDDIHLNLLSHGLWSPGVVAVEQWRELIQGAARHHGEVIGVDADACPLDTGSTIRFQRAFRSLPPRHPIPAPLTVEEVDAFVERHPEPHAKVWLTPNLGR